MNYEGPRGAKREELDAIVSLVSDTFSGPNDLINYGYFLFEPENADNLRIMSYDGIPVTHVGLKRFKVKIYGCALSIACIGGVCTRPEHRGKGLASRVLADAWEKMRAEGVDFVMISGNRGLYWRAGAAQCSPTLHFIVPPASTTADLSAKILPGELDGAAETMLRIYESERVRFKRTTEQLQKICAPRSEIEERAILALWEDAYLLGWRSEEKDGANCIRVQEYAGNRVGLSKEAPSLAAKLGGKLHFDVPAWDEEMIKGLLANGNKERITNYPDTTIKILALDSLMEKTRSVWTAKIDAKTAEKLSFRQDGDEAEISLGAEIVRLQGQEIGELVFGTTEEREYAAERPEVRDLLKRIFPLPVPRYGLNYL